MLLLYAVLFLNSIVVKATTRRTLVDGWKVVPGETSVPTLSRVYWITPTKWGFDYSADRRSPGVVLYKIGYGDFYRVARMKKYDKGGLSADQFFAPGAVMPLEGGGCAPLSQYRIFPHEFHSIEGKPKHMKLYDGIVLEMPTEHFHRLVVASGMVDGWDASRVHVPFNNAIYWIHAPVLEITGPLALGLYLPCVVIGQFFNEHQHLVNQYLVIMMSRELYPIEDGQLATDFFQDTTKLGLPLPELNDITNYYIYPGKIFRVEGRPDIMKSWEYHVTILPSGRTALLGTVGEFDWSTSEQSSQRR